MLISCVTDAQNKKKLRKENMEACREFAQLGQWYMKLPIQMKVHFSYKAIPVTDDQDSTDTDMILYYGKNNFYMQAENVEQIINDTMVVIVNNEARVITLYHNEDDLMSTLKKITSLLMPDSAVEKLADLYDAKTESRGDGTSAISLQSKEKITGTNLVKETINVIYKPVTLEPVEYDQSRFSLIPIDSAVYSRLNGVSAFAGRLVKVKMDAEDLFFVVKEKITHYGFSQILNNQLSSPVKEQDRISKDGDGSYVPAKGYEGYLLSKEF